MPPSPLPGIFFFQITCSEIVSEALFGPKMLIFSEQNFKSYYKSEIHVSSDCRLCVTWCTEKPLSIKVKVHSQKSAAAKMAAASVCATDGPV